MIRLVLTEHRTTYGVPLNAGSREALRRVHPGMRIEPSAASADRFDLTPDQRIGLIVLPDLTIEIRPKIPMARAVFLISYACGAARWSDDEAHSGSSDDLCELMAILLAHSVEQATRGGLLCGYHTVDDLLPAPRGRINFDHYVGRRLAMSPPIDVRHDLFSPDVLENQLLLAGLLAFRKLRLRSRASVQRLQNAQLAFGGVSRMEFHRSRVPTVLFTRLNRHYRAPIELARLVLQSCSTDLTAGGSRAAAFLIDLNVVFEQFVRRALREELEPKGLGFPDRPPAIFLDRADRIPLRPDLAALRDGNVLWLGDAKYKRLPGGAYLNADIYQMMAYVVGHQLGSGTLIYAADEGVNSATHRVRHLNRDIHVRALDLSAPPRSLLSQIRLLAAEVLRCDFRSAESARGSRASN